MASVTDERSTGRGRGDDATQRRGALLRDPAYQAYLVLWVGFALAPVLFGVDKFFDWMTDWDLYLWSGISDAVNVEAGDLMLVVGAIEILAGILVLLRPRYAAPVVAAWLTGIVVNLLIASADGPFEFWDVALRDFGLVLGAVALARLATRFDPDSGPLTGSLRDART